MRVPSPVARLLDGFEDGGQIQPATAPAVGNSIAMSSKLADHRSSLNEPYFKSRQRAAGKGTSDSSELVQLRRKSAAISRDFGTLLTAHERQEACVTDLRLKVRQLRQQLEARDKSLELARRTLDRLAIAKGQLEAGAAGTQAYVRKLEARLLSVKHAVELQQQCAQLKSQLDQMAHALHEAEGRAGKAEAEAKQSHVDAACLKRALELAAEQLTKSVGAEVPSTLLRAVARGQEEALGLSMQLSDSKQQQAHLATALEQAREHLQAQQQALAQQQTERQQLVQRAEAADAALETQKAATVELRRVLDALKPKAGALAEERDSLRQQLELERTAAAEAQQQAKDLQAALKHKRVTEAALRDELRRALAGTGLTPNPAAPPQAASPAAARRRLAGAAGTIRSSSVRLRQQDQQSPLQQQQHSKRLGSALSPSEQSAQKVVIRAASWEQHEGGRYHSPFIADLSKRGMDQHQQQQQQQQQDHGTFDAVTDGCTPAMFSGSAAEWKLERRSRQLAEQQEGQREAAELADWQDAAWQHQEPQQVLQSAATAAPAPARFEPQQTDGVGPQGFDGMCGLLSPPSTDSRATATKAASGLPAASRQELLRLRVPSVAEIPLQDGRLMRVYASALDEQIAALETDLQALEASGAPSPVTQLQLMAKAGASPAAAVPAGGQKPQAGAAAALKSPGCTAQMPPQQHPSGAQAAGAAISAWRPNSVFNAAVQQAGSPDTVNLEAPGSPTRPTPAVWHSNPLAGSPPKPPPQMLFDQEAEVEQAPPECAADGALTVRQRSEAAAVDGSAGGSGPGAAGVDDWVWGQLQVAVAAPAGSSSLLWPPLTHPVQAAAADAAAVCAGSAGSAASSPSLRLPATEPSAVYHHQQQQQRQQHREQEDELHFPASSTAEQPDVQLQPWVARPAASQGSQGAADSGVHSLSRHWEQPSPCEGQTDWLSTGEADIELLEVTSTPPRTQQPQRQQQRQEQEVEAEAAWEAAAAAFAAQQEPLPQQHCWMQPAERSGKDSGSWATQCDGASNSGSEGGGAEQQASLQLQAGFPQQAAREAPFLPGMALVAHSPQPVPVAAAEQGRGRGERQQQVVQQTLFDLAGLDLSDVLH